MFSSMDCSRTFFPFQTDGARDPSCYLHPSSLWWYRFTSSIDSPQRAQANARDGRVETALSQPLLLSCERTQHAEKARVATHGLRTLVTTSASRCQEDANFYRGRPRAVVGPPEAVAGTRKSLCWASGVGSHAAATASLGAHNALWGGGHI
jgi:hypothetical protein